MGANKRYAISFYRIDNSKGYIIGNVVLCLLKVNTAKGDFTLEEMRDWMPRWYEKANRFLTDEEF